MQPTSISPADSLGFSAFCTRVRRLLSDLSTKSTALAAIQLPSSLNRPFDPPLRVASDESKAIGFAKVTLPNRED
ncbi:hypothetical protein Landi51_04040 [Colletotrichum acutatum]